MEFEETKGDASDVELDVSDSTVLTKYRTAADIANRACRRTGDRTRAIANPPSRMPSAPAWSASIPPPRHCRHLSLQGRCRA